MQMLGARIHQKRKEMGLSLEELGTKLGVSRQCVSKWENCGVKNIDRDHIAKMAQIFHVSPSWLMGFESSDAVTVTYEAPGKEPVKAIAKQTPIIGSESLRAQLYHVAIDVKPENLPVAIEILKSLT